MSCNKGVSERGHGVPVVESTPAPVPKSASLAAGCDRSQVQLRAFCAAAIYDTLMENITVGMSNAALNYVREIRKSHDTEYYVGDEPVRESDCDILSRHAELDEMQRQIDCRRNELRRQSTRE